MPYSKFFIYQASSVKMAGYWPSSLFAFLSVDLDFVSVHKNAKRELGQYPAILTSRLVNNIYVIHGLGLFICHIYIYIYIYVYIYIF